MVFNGLVIFSLFVVPGRLKALSLDAYVFPFVVLCIFWFLLGPYLDGARLDVKQ